MSERFVRFDRHINNVGEIIDADHVNVLQEREEVSQKQIIKGKDYDFLDKALFVLDNHRFLNGMWIDLFQDTSYIDIGKTTLLEYSEDEQAIIFPNASISSEAYAYSKTYVNENRSSMKSVIVMADIIKPEQTDIIIEVSNNNVDWYPVEVGSSEPYTIPTEGYQLKLRATFVRTDIQVTPVLNAWAIMYYDERLNVVELDDGDEVIITNPDAPWDGKIDLFHSQLRGIGPDDHHPQEHTHDGSDGSGVISHSVLIDIGEDDHHDKDHRHGQDGVDYVHLDEDVVGTLDEDHLSYRVWTGKPGDTGLYFDPSMDDKLVYVKTPDDETYLFYDVASGRLTHTITIIQGVAVWEKMIYGEYINSKGEAQTVLKGTEKVHHEATDTLIIDEINKVSAPPIIEGLVISNLGVGNQARIDWAVSTAIDLAGYNVYMSVDGSVNFIKINTALLIDPTYLASGLTIGKEYYFFITAEDYSGKESSPSVTKSVKITPNDSIPPARVENVGIQALPSHDLRVSWDANVEIDLSHYKIYRSESGSSSSFAEISTVLKTDLYFIDIGLTQHEDYFYYVTAVDISGNESIASNIVVSTVI